MYLLRHCWSRRQIGDVLVAETKRRAVGSTKEHLDTGALACRLELASDRFAQSDLQDLNRLGFGRRDAGQSVVESFRMQAGSLVAQHGSSEAQKSQGGDHRRSTAAHCTDKAHNGGQGQPPGPPQ